MKISKETRLKVYEKYNGHCAYCGCGIDYKDMQVDHIYPKQAGGSDDIDNLNPSCRTCNHYKRGCSLDSFKNWLLAGLIDRLRKIYIFRVAEKYGMVTVNDWNKEFYFERERITLKDEEMKKVVNNSEKE